jgi:hypothetical protein
MGLGGQRHAPAALPTEKETLYLLYRRLGWPHGRSGWVRKISPPPGQDPWTVQPIESVYTDYATPARYFPYTTFSCRAFPSRIIFLSYSDPFFVQFLVCRFLLLLFPFSSTSDVLARTVLKG